MYIHVWASALLFLTGRAMRDALQVGRATGTATHTFFVSCQNEIHQIFIHVRLWDAGRQQNITNPMKQRLLLSVLAVLLALTMRAENIAQVIWTGGNTTLTFLSSETLYAVGDNYNGLAVTAVWNGGDVTASPSTGAPAWKISAVYSTLTTVVFDESFKNVHPKSTRSWFDNCSSLEKINGIEYLNTSETTSMAYMFSYCPKLTSLDVSNFDTRNVTDMQLMFGRCRGLTSLDVSHFNTQNVKNMDGMFYGCSGITSLDLSNFDTRNVTNMTHMFYDCSSLTSLDLSNFNTQNVTDMSYMFCSGLNTGYDSGYDSSLTSLDVSSFDTQNVKNMEAMFYGCKYLTSLDVSGFNTQNVTNMGAMFSGCSRLTSLDVSNFDTQNVTQMGNMFNYCASLTSLDVSGFNTQNVTNMYGMFYGCVGLTNLDVSNFDTQNVTNMYGMFYRCEGLTNLDLSNFNTNKVTDMSDMFYGCVGLTILDLSNFSTYNVRNYRNMFGFSEPPLIFIPADTKAQILAQQSVNMVLKDDEGNFSCASFKPIVDVELTIPYTFTATITSDAPQKEGFVFNGWNTMADGTGTSYLPGQTDAVVNKGKITFFPIFRGPIAQAVLLNRGANNQILVFLNSLTQYTKGDVIEGYNDYVVNTVWIGEDVTNSPETDYPAWHSVLSNSRNLKTVVFEESFKDVLPKSTFAWFLGCNRLEVVKGIENLNTSETTNMRAMFSDCSRLTSLDLSNFNTQNVTNMAGMFSFCSGLTSLDLSNFNTQNVTNMDYMFSHCSGLITLDLSNFNTANVVKADDMFQQVNLALIFIPADTKAEIRQDYRINMVLKDADGNFSCASFSPIENVEMTIPYTFTANFVTRSGRNGYIFKEWNTSADGTGTSYYSGQTDVVIEKGKLTLYALYDKEDTYTVAGEESLLGSEWDAQDTRNDMIKNTETGLYELSWKDKALTAGEYEYKVAVNHSWEESYGRQDGSNCVLVIPETSTYNVTIYFDADAKYAWAEFANSETSAVKAGKAVVADSSVIYDLGGRRIETPAKGISIVRNADGSLRKVMR